MVDGLKREKRCFEVSASGVVTVFYDGQGPAEALLETEAPANLLSGQEIALETGSESFVVG